MPILKGDLPDLFAFDGGGRVTSPDDWRRRRAELATHLLDLEYGPLPPPAPVVAELLHSHQPVARLLGARHATYRLRIEGGAEPFGFGLDLLVPPSDGQRQPVVICGDACWKYLTDAVALEVLRRGYALATFNRTELAPDIYRTDRDTALYRVFPESPHRALGAWAWGYHRVVDFLLTLDWVDPERLAVVGHSRGGKTVLLAGATDERVALTAPNNSGSGGAGCYRWQGEGCETLADGVRLVPYWYADRLADFVGREEDLPFDQHALKALVAPRALLSTEALGDLWANPTGTWQTHAAAREVYRFLGASDRIGVWYREGSHQHGLRDWQTFLDFADWQLRGREPVERYDINPFGELPSCFGWRAPDAP